MSDLSVFRGDAVELIESLTATEMVRRLRASESAPVEDIPAKIDAEEPHDCSWCKGRHAGYNIRDCPPPTASVLTYRDGVSAGFAAAAEVCEARAKLMPHGSVGWEAMHWAAITLRAHPSAGAEPKMDIPWIAYTELMPEDGQECVFRPISGISHAGRYLAGGRMGREYPTFQGVGVSFTASVVTHWMPLPADEPRASEPKEPVL